MNNDAELRGQLRSTVEAIRQAYLRGPNEIYDEDVQQKLLELFQYLQSHDTEQQQRMQPLEKLLAETANKMVLQLLEITPSPKRYNLLRTILYDSMESLGHLAYTEEGEASFLLDMLAVVQHLPPLKCHERGEGHRSSVMGVLLNCTGFIKPFYSGDSAVKVFADSLEALASLQGPLTLGGIIKDCMELLCYFLETRSSHIQGVPYGLANGRVVGIEYLTSSLEEMNRLAHTCNGMDSGHYGWVFTYKLAMADAQLLAEMHDSGSTEFNAAHNAIQVHVNALLACA